MVIGILQPGYLPWLGFFEQLYKSDVFVIYDDVQYDKNGWRNRNRIKTAEGIQWITIPVRVKLSEFPLINEIRIDNRSNWRSKHLSSIKQNYSKAPFFKKYISIFTEIYAREWDYLIDIDMAFILKLADCLGISGEKIVLSSTLHVEGEKLERLVKICKKLNADTFYEGSSGRSYIDKDYFLRRGINIQYQDYEHPSYNQLYGVFIPYLSVIDLLFNHGDESLRILTNQDSEMAHG